jgi:hypothetical protein
VDQEKNISRKLLRKFIYPGETTQGLSLGFNKPFAIDQGIPAGKNR